MSTKETDVIPFTMSFALPRLASKAKHKPIVWNSLNFYSLSLAVVKYMEELQSLFETNSQTQV